MVHRFFIQPSPVEVLWTTRSADKFCKTQLVGSIMILMKSTTFKGSSKLVMSNSNDPSIQMCHDQGQDDKRLKAPGAEVRDCTYHSQMISR